MSLPQTQNAPPNNPSHGLLNAVAERLIPLFLLPGQTPEHARAAALEAMSAYGAESGADYASIGRILALSLAAIGAIGKSANPDLTPAQQLGFLAKANAISRSVEQAERGMTQRRKQRGTQPDTKDDRIGPPKAKSAFAATPEPADEAVLAQIDAAMAEFHTMLPAAERPPFAAMPNVPRRPSIRQALRDHAPTPVLDAIGQAAMTEAAIAAGLKHAAGQKAGPGASVLR